MNISRRYHMRYLLGALGSPMFGSLLVTVNDAWASMEKPPAEETKALHQRFMEQAFGMRQLAVDKGDQAYGAIIVRGDEVVAQAPSRVVINGDPTAHAEMEAIRDAASRLANRNLTGCVMYSSSRPCPMCEAAAYWAGIDNLYHGTGITNVGAPKLRRC